MKDLTNASLAKEIGKSKCFWQQSCKWYLTQKNKMGGKDIEIEEMGKQVTPLVRPTSLLPLPGTLSMKLAAQDVGCSSVPTM